MLVLSLRWINPPGSAVILAYNLQHEIIARHKWIELGAISPWLQVSAIAAEDQKFLQHSGFDFESIKKSLGENRSRPRGASTITQQTAKNLFLWNGRSYVRKLFEAWFTVLIELLWPKERILEVYLNIAEFGPGVYGAEIASREFLGSSAENITPWEAGLMIAVLPNPKRLSLARPSEYVQNRAQKIVQISAQLGGIRFLEKM